MLKERLAIHGNLSQSNKRSLATWNHTVLPVITQCYLPPDTGKCTQPLTQPDRLALDLKADLTLVVSDIRRWCVYLSTESHPSKY